MGPLLPGDPHRVGRYRLGGRLGEGGMGEVFWGRSPSGRPVAVKLVHRHLAAQPEFRRRFAQEVDAARRVGGFHTASVVDADPDGDRPWLVTAYVAGPSLAAAVERTGPFELATLRVLGAGLAEALEAVHAAGVVHRDLKPTNVLLAEDGPRVIDFGIARALDATALTSTGATIGTPKYMAPEQFSSESPITPAADVFAWASVICHAAGVRPFGDGPAAAVAVRIIHQPADLSGVPDPLRDVVARCFDKAPAGRPSPGELLDQLTDGTSSVGWLPPPVRAMVAEFALPESFGPVAEPSAPGPTVPFVASPTVPATPDEEETPRIERAATRMLTPHRPPPPSPPRRRLLRRGFLIGAAALTAAALIVGVVLVIASLPGVSTRDAAEPVVGTWHATEGDGSDVTLRITRPDASAYAVALADSSATVCGGSAISLATSGRQVDGTLQVTRTGTCPGSTAALEPYDDGYRYDAATAPGSCFAAARPDFPGAESGAAASSPRSAAPIGTRIPSGAVTVRSPRTTCLASSASRRSGPG